MKAIEWFPEEQYLSEEYNTNTRICLMCGTVKSWAEFYAKRKPGMVRPAGYCKQCATNYEKGKYLPYTLKITEVK